MLRHFIWFSALLYILVGFVLFNTRTFSCLFICQTMKLLEYERIINGGSNVMFLDLVWINLNPNLTLSGRSPNSDWIYKYDPTKDNE